jgi:hypothetical protein
VKSAGSTDTNNVNLGICKHSIGRVIRLNAVLLCKCNSSRLINVGNTNKLCTVILLSGS